MSEREGWSADSRGNIQGPPLGEEILRAGGDVVDMLVEGYTGEGRDPLYADAEEYGHDGSFSTFLPAFLGTVLLANEDDFRGIIEQFHGDDVEFQEDRDGRLMVKTPEYEDFVYVNAPGMSGRDVGQIISGIVSFLPGAALGAMMKTPWGRALTTGALEAAVTVFQGEGRQAAGAEEGASGYDAALAFVMGGGGARMFDSGGTRLYHGTPGNEFREFLESYVAPPRHGTWGNQQFHLTDNLNYARNRANWYELDDMGHQVGLNPPSERGSVMTYDLFSENPISFLATNRGHPQWGSVTSRREGLRGALGETEPPIPFMRGDDVAGAADAERLSLEALAQGYDSIHARMDPLNEIRHWNFFNQRVRDLRDAGRHAEADRLRESMVKNIPMVSDPNRWSWNFMNEYAFWDEPFARHVSPDPLARPGAMQGAAGGYGGMQMGDLLDWFAEVQNTSEE